MQMVAAYSVLATIWVWVLGHYLRPIFAAIRARRSS
jgi:hypothetical protein